MRHDHLGPFCRCSLPLQVISSATIHPSSHGLTLRQKANFATTFQDGNDNCDNRNPQCSQRLSPALGVTHVRCVHSSVKVSGDVVRSFAHHTEHRASGLQTSAGKGLSPVNVDHNHLINTNIHWKLAFSCSISSASWPCPQGVSQMLGLRQQGSVVRSKGPRGHSLAVHEL